ncbi:SCP2 sterol-binding domain-containing protein [Zwartia sp.]|uniref:ubiquinone biosynthesis accessory factor UbiJ n=1 Tax=Zwartia sp. TaxID=2978004 RepID=UPI0027189B60|nr:SCP2 sterol-binding domain-containing protein [Zwartia sp.]MDO9025614.1 hypothetical protein [Zwartia sp.]
MHPVQAIAHAFNTLTRQQVWAAQRLALHAGKTIRIVVGGFQLHWTINADGTLVHTEQTVTPDVTLEVLVEKFNPLSFFEQSPRPDLAEYVHVSGQAALAQVISELARELRPDPEDALAQWIGDIPARRLVGGVKQAFQSTQRLGVDLAQNLAEYLSEETDMLVGRPAMTTHQARQTSVLLTLAQLEQRQARLLARVQKLERSMGAST